MFSRLASRETSLYGAETGMTSLTPGRFSKAPASTVPRLPVIPMAVRWAPGIGWACKPSPWTVPTTRWMSSAVAAASMTMSMRVLSS